MLTNHAIHRVVVDKRADIDEETLYCIAKDIYHKRDNVFVMGKTINNHRLRMLVFGYGQPVHCIWDTFNNILITVLETHENYRKIRKMLGDNIPLKNMYNHINQQIIIMRRRGYDYNNPKLEEFVHYRKIVATTMAFRSGNFQ